MEQAEFKLLDFRDSSCKSTTSCQEIDENGNDLAST